MEVSVADVNVAGRLGGFEDLQVALISHPASYVT